MGSLHLSPPLPSDVHHPGFLSNRHATRCPGDLPGHSPPQAGHDVLGYAVQGNQGDVQEVHAECEYRVGPKEYADHFQPLEIYVDDETKLTLHGLQQYYLKLEEKEKNRKLNDLLDNLEFNQVSSICIFKPVAHRSQVCIFVKSVARATQLDALLQECNFPSICIHSALPQPER
jgi:hypothetical protein